MKARSLLLTASLALFACAPPAETAETAAETLAVWGEDSGSLPPEYAWSYTVSFLSDGMVRAEYCKGYADAAPGCATSQSRMTEGEQTAAAEAFRTVAEDLAAHPPRVVSPEDMQVGGGMAFGWILLDDRKIELPGQLHDADRARVAALVKVLQDQTPAGLVDKAKSKAKAP